MWGGERRREKKHEEVEVECGVIKREYNYQREREGKKKWELKKRSVCELVWFGLVWFWF